MTTPEIPVGVPALGGEAAVIPAQRNGLSRRRVLQLGGIAAVSSLLRADQMITKQLWPESNGHLDVLDEPDSISLDNGWAVVPGFGSRYGWTMAHDLSRTLGSNQPVAYLDYSTSGFDISEISRKLTGYAEKLSGLSIYGHSMGGPTAFSALRDSDVPLDRILLNCSPFDIDDARSGTLAHLVARASKLFHYEGSFATNYLCTVSDKVRRNGISHVFGDIVDGWDDTMHGPAPDLVTKQLEFLDSVNLEKDWHKYEPNFTGLTEVVYALPNNVENDQTVNDLAALEKWKHWFAHFDIGVKVIDVHDAGHANTLRTLNASRAWLRQAAQA